jgi:hypothetical protein
MAAARQMKQWAERYKNVKQTSFVHFTSNGKIEIKSDPIKEFMLVWQYAYQICNANRLIRAFLNETFAFLK